MRLVHGPLVGNRVDPQEIAGRGQETLDLPVGKAVELANQEPDHDHPLADRFTTGRLRVGVEREPVDQLPEALKDQGSLVSQPLGKGGPADAFDTLIEGPDLDLGLAGKVKDCFGYGGGGG